jgi:hypothetical protein
MARSCASVYRAELALNTPFAPTAYVSTPANGILALEAPLGGGAEKGGFRRRSFLQELHVSNADG